MEKRITLDQFLRICTINANINHVKVIYSDDKICKSIRFINVWKNMKELVSLADKYIDEISTIIDREDKEPVIIIYLTSNEIKEE